jgi:hypothetical protein
MPAFAIYLRLGWVSSRNGLLFCTDDASRKCYCKYGECCLGFDQANLSES